MTVVFHKLAQAELDQAAEAYYQLHPLLGREFVATVERGIGRLSAFPDSGAPIRRWNSPPCSRTVSVQRHLFERGRVPVIVVAVAHQRRLPDYWHDRRTAPWCERSMSLRGIPRRFLWALRERMGGIARRVDSHVQLII